MDKKQNSYTRQGSNKLLITESRKSDISQSKPLPRGGRRRESSNNSNIFKNDQRINKHNNNNNNKFRSNVDKRPKPRTFGNNHGNSNNALAESFSGSGLGEDFKETIEDGEDDENKNGNFRDDSVAEMNSIYLSGSKKQNLNHLLNFHYVPYDGNNSGNGLNVFGRCSSNKAFIKRQRYNKEQYLQANFQFLVKKSAEPFIDVSNPDTLIGWEFIEQINIQTTEEPQCPICLYPPIAAKLTRCGHVYCWPCILHYLALSDKTWRKCPICYEAIHVQDLKSTLITQQQNFKINDSITFQLMRRKKGSIFAEKCPENENEAFIENIPYINENKKPNFFSKLLIVNVGDILSIVEREFKELQKENVVDCPEALFVQQALDLLKERKSAIAQEQGLSIEYLDKLTESTTEKVLTINEDNINQLASQLEVMNVEVEKKDVCEEQEQVMEIKEIESENGTTADLGAIKKEKFYYFYQSTDGQNVFLHPLNVKMLQSMYGTLNKGPKIIESRILQKDFYSMDEDLRKKFTCLGHLPLTCQFEVIEINLEPPIVSDHVLNIFKGDIASRQKVRNRRDREEKKRERRINEFNDRQMGKLLSRSANIDIESVQQFPTCGFEEPLSPNSYEEATIRAYDADLADSPPPPSTLSNVIRIKPSTSFATILLSPKKEVWPSLSKSNTMQNETVWGVRKDSIQINSPNTNRDIRTSESDIGEIFVPSNNSLSDVLAEALEIKKKQNISDSVTGKKCKKSKKTLLFSTGMSFSGN
ncbi:RING finger protein 10 [Condylostylus longicornis]|uniref:RING finger protein 10 n=1 Tax=Condylostylus longicornis TaxID=2530218 RepID=UPI00244E0654|nr:RING finger protein 10 [Condylostylus longicornis]